MKNNHLAALLGVLFCSILYPACSAANAEPVVIWTNRIELVSYAEFFNATQDAAKAVVVYKEDPAAALLEGATTNEAPPDIVIGPWLKNLTIKRYFRPLDYLFTEQQINRYAFYRQLLEQGQINGKHYILPVSFNLPAVMFDAANQSYVPDGFMLTLDQIRNGASSFNVKSRTDVYTSLGFAPSWKPEFLYLVSKLKNVRLSAQKDSLVWDGEALNEAVAFLRDWTLTSNTATASEQDFAFKYLYTPSYKQVTSGKCLFNYTTSDAFFSIAKDQLEKLDFRWVCENRQIPVEDSAIFLGIYKKSKNAASETFISWFMNENTQQRLLERFDEMHLNTVTFGIAGGFSALRPVTERFFPSHYPLLLGNTPASEYITAPETLPTRWSGIKTRVVLPYLAGATDTKNETPPATMENLLADWNSQYF
jgi:ABC-type glycerol-3-phosphate transport system substrate-binding protein